MAAGPDGGMAREPSGADRALPRWQVVVLDEERRLDDRLRALLVHALPALVELLASRAGSDDGATERGER